MKSFNNTIERRLSEGNIIAFAEDCWQVYGKKFAKNLRSVKFNIALSEDDVDCLSKKLNIWDTDKYFKEKVLFYLFIFAAYILSTEKSKMHLNAIECNETGKDYLVKTLYSNSVKLHIEDFNLAFSLYNFTYRILSKYDINISYLYIIFKNMNLEIKLPSISRLKVK